MTDIPNCETCRYWDVSELEAENIANGCVGYGLCRINPPEKVRIDECQWPRSRNDDWCGWWEVRDDD